MSSGKVKSSQLWNKSKEDLEKQLDELKVELGQLRTQKIAGGGASKLQRISDVRKSIARTMTVIHATQRHQLRLYYKDKKHLPLDLRPKSTRAIRRRLTKEEAGRRTPRQIKRERHFPQRRFAVRL